VVVGAGSIGRRHLGNLRKLGVQRLTACDPDPERLVGVDSELRVSSCTDFEKALATKPDAVLICTPPVLHVAQALAAVEAGAHVFIEKPLSHNLDGTIELVESARKRNRIVQVGYNLRFHPGLQKLKVLIDDGTLGKVLWAYVEVGQYLPDWRPSQDYRQSYTARRELGGGILLDGSHELDYITWLLGASVEVACMASKVSALEVNVEDCADLLLHFASGARATVHLDFIQRGYSRSCKVVGELGTAVWDFTAKEVRVLQAQTNTWQGFPYSFEPNDMYMAEIEHFLKCIARGERPLVDVSQAAAVLKLVLAAKSSSERRCVESVS
jgi:predicted dehydrogenase